MKRPAASCKRPAAAVKKPAVARTDLHSKILGQITVRTMIVD